MIFVGVAHRIQNKKTKAPPLLAGLFCFDLLNFNQTGHFEPILLRADST